jgi:hypothetical protein
LATHSLSISEGSLGSIERLRRRSRTVHPSNRDLVSATKSYVEFPRHSIQAFFTESCPASVSSLKIEIRTRSLHIYRPILVQLDTMDLHTMLVNICGFHENRRQGAQMKLGLRVRRGTPPQIVPPAVKSLPHCAQCPDVPRPTQFCPNGTVRGCPSRGLLSAGRQILVATIWVTQAPLTAAVHKNCLRDSCGLFWFLLTTKQFVLNKRLVNVFVKLSPLQYKRRHLSIQCPPNCQTASLFGTFPGFTR